jgi:predicted GNAT family acetyltransferase
MFQKINVSDRILSQDMFIADEVQYNLIHLICESKSSTCLKDSDETMIYAQSTGHNAWLWSSKDIVEDKKAVLYEELIEFLKETTLPGVSGEPKTTERFAQLYSQANHLQYESTMTIESYFCTDPKKPLNVKGTMQQATRKNLAIVAEFLAGFSEGAYGVRVNPEAKILDAKRMIETGDLYIWFVDDKPVSMAYIAHRSARYSRLNAVYTPPSCRKKGYASALVAELCSVLLSEDLVPMLYADLKNPDSNKVYRNIGFVERGKIVDIKFK